MTDESLGSHAEAQELVSSFHDAWNVLTAPGAPFGFSVQEVNGSPARVFDAAPPNMRLIWEMSQAHADRDFLVYGSQRYTYADAHAAVRVLAHWLRDAHGVGRGDRVAVAMRNYPEWVLGYWATISVGAALVGMNAWWTGPEMAFALGDSAPKVLIVDGERLDRVLGQLDGLSDPPTVLATRLESQHDRTELAERGVQFWDDVITPAALGDPPAELPDAEIVGHDDACIFYTSGTTGSPKGAVLTHQGSVHNLLNIAFVNACGDMARAQRQAADPHRSTQEPDDPPEQAVALLPVPLFHVTGCNCVMHPVTAAGGRLVLMHRWDPTEALRLIEAEKVSVFTGVPTMSRELLAHPDWAATDTSSLASMGGGGAAVQPDLVLSINDNLASGRPSTGYGLTETTGIATAINSEYYVARPGSVGPVVPCMEAKLVDPDTKADLGLDATGELAVRGPNVIKGYLNQPEATAQTIIDGWLHTGDIARIDSDGWVHIVDRAKDVVIRGGENVHCGEVENAIYEHGAVAEAAVFGVPDERLGEAVAVALVLHPDAQLSSEGLGEFLEGRIARFKHPSHVWLREEPLPRNANGKFVKRMLRDELIAQLSG